MAAINLETWPWSQNNQLWFDSFEGQSGLQESASRSILSMISNWIIDWKQQLFYMSLRVQDQEWWSRERSSLLSSHSRLEAKTTARTFQHRVFFNCLCLGEMLTVFSLTCNSSASEPYCNFSSNTWKDGLDRTAFWTVTIDQPAVVFTWNAASSLNYVKTWLILEWRVSLQRKRL